jgi:hypothetical protein
MPAKPGQKMLTLWVEESDRNALQALCTSNGTSVSRVLRRWILTAIQEQTTDLVSANPDIPSERSSGAGVPPEMLKDLMQRLASLEKAMPKFNEDDLVEMREEILSGESGSMRYRMGIVEAQLQSLGGSIAWKSEPRKSD